MDSYWYFTCSVIAVLFAVMIYLFTPSDGGSRKQHIHLCLFAAGGFLTMSATHKWVGAPGLELVVLGISLMAACYDLNQTSTQEKNPDSWGDLGCWTFLMAVIFVASGIFQLLPIP